MIGKVHLAVCIKAFINQTNKSNKIIVEKIEKTKDGISRIKTEISNLN